MQVFFHSLCIRDAAREVDMAFPVSIAVNEARFASAKIIVFESYCSMGKGEADWHGLALSVIQHTWIDEIINFRKLMVSHNTLKELPDSVTKMKNLLRLDVSHNNLTEIPKELFELPLLRNLNVSFNYLEELPEVTAGEWSNSIKILNVRANTLKTLPGTIADSCIEDLNLADNSLYHVPPSVCHVKTLTNLDISRNRYITVLPPDLGKLSKLTTLGLKGMDQVSAIVQNICWWDNFIKQMCASALQTAIQVWTGPGKSVGQRNSHFCPHGV